MNSFQKYTYTLVETLVLDYNQPIWISIIMSAVGPVKEIGHLPTIKLQVQNQISEWYHWPKAYMILSCQTPAEELDQNHQMENEQSGDQ